jgi:hypothetical protein
VESIDKIIEDMKELKNWEKVNIGYYRFNYAPKKFYEIFIEYWYPDTPIETARASLCRLSENGFPIDKIDRIWLKKNLPVFELIEIAQKDSEELKKYRHNI